MTIGVYYWQRDFKTKGETMKPTTKQSEMKHLSLFATDEEWDMFEAIKRYHLRKTDSDTLRFLIKQEAEKIFAKTTPTGVN